MSEITIKAVIGKLKLQWNGTGLLIGRDYIDDPAELKRLAMFILENIKTKEDEQI